MASYDARDEIADLQRLLGAAGIQPPYVLVGHSYGGMLARLFASEHSEETAGVVLVDARGSDATRRQLAIWPRSQAPAASRAVFKRVQHGVDLASGEALASHYETWATPRWQSLVDRGQPTGTARLSGTQRRDKQRPPTTRASTRPTVSGGFAGSVPRTRSPRVLDACGRLRLR